MHARNKMVERAKIPRKKGKLHGRKTVEIQPVDDNSKAREDCKKLKTSGTSCPPGDGPAPKQPFQVSEKIIEILDDTPRFSRLKGFEIDSKSIRDRP